MNLSDIFNIEYGKFKLPIKKLKLGTTPLISSSGVNNGVVGFFDLKPIYCKVISVARTGSVGETFFHNYDCVINSDCMVLSPKFSLTDNEMFWYVLNIGNHKKKFSYGRKVTPERLGLIQLPSDIPKWVNKIKLESIDLSETFNNSKRISISTANWKYFKYMELFNIRKGKRLTESNFTSGVTPFIGAIDSNNGYRDFIGQQPIHEGNTITVNYNGSIGEVFYQPIPFWASDDVNVLYPKFKLNQYIALFLVSLIKKEKFRFNFGRKWELERMNESKIKLPVDKTGNPDLQFMEEYIKSLPYSKNL